MDGTRGERGFRRHQHPEKVAAGLHDQHEPGRTKASPQLLPRRHALSRSIISSQLAASEGESGAGQEQLALQDVRGKRAFSSGSWGRVGLNFKVGLMTLSCGLWLPPQIQLWTRVCIQPRRSCCLSAANTSDVLQVSSASPRRFSCW